MGVPSIVFFGPDDSLRIPVLAHAGYRVEACEALAELSRILDAPGLDALICSEAPGRPADAAALLARRRGDLALILFQHPAMDTRDSLFDMVIAPGTLPGRWLQMVAERLYRRSGQRPVESPAAAERAWSEIARDLRSMHRGVSEKGEPGEESQNAPGKGRIQVGKRSWL